jgi:hypothetical protein
VRILCYRGPLPPRFATGRRRSSCRLHGRPDAVIASPFRRSARIIELQGAELFRFAEVDLNTQSGSLDSTPSAVRQVGIGRDGQHGGAHFVRRAGQRCGHSSRRYVVHGHDVGWDVLDLDVATHGPDLARGSDAGSRILVREAPAP